MQRMLINAFGSMLVTLCLFSSVIAVMEHGAAATQVATVA